MRKMFANLVNHGMELVLKSRGLQSLAASRLDLSRLWLSSSARTSVEMSLSLDAANTSAHATIARHRFLEQTTRYFAAFRFSDFSWYMAASARAIKSSAVSPGRQDAMPTDA